MAKGDLLFAVLLVAHLTMPSRGVDWIALELEEQFRLRGPRSH